MEYLVLRFWKELGGLLSRVNEDEAYVDIVKPDVMAKQALDDRSRKKSDLVRQRHAPATVTS